MNFHGKVKQNLTIDNHISLQSLSHYISNNNNNNKNNLKLLVIKKFH